MLKRFTLHLEWHPGYWPRVSFKKAPYPGQRIVDGGVPGVLVICRECEGSGVLHQPDSMAGLWPEPAAPLQGPIPEYSGNEALPPTPFESPDRIELGITNARLDYQEGKTLYTMRAEYRIEKIWVEGSDKRMLLVKIPGTELDG